MMRKPDGTDLAPVFWAYGKAVFSAQHLEASMRILLQVIDGERKQSNLKPLNIDLDDPKAHVTSGDLLKKVIGIEYLTDAEQKLIWKAIRHRNILVHSFWDKRHLLAMMTLEGREWLIKDAEEKEQHCDKAVEIINYFVNQYAAKYGTSVKAIAEAISEVYEVDTTPPNSVLQ